MPHDDGRKALRRAIDDEPPPGVDALDDASAQALATLIEDSRRAQQRQLQDALERALGYLPRLLRGPVRRVLFPRRGD
ncbi:hypothetical protein [Algiphilus sp.]|uniref:hypothetical protein n=1 Tax=Algiphilus sp. TaxID=1872431 RepID=UPI0025C15E9E|nr:hypothetical protein [Algiphilus sp.]MCK5770972.1 hypothetical protein [Algiphilus sp.]